MRKHLFVAALLWLFVSQPAPAQQFVLPSSFAGWTCASPTGLNVAQPSGPVAGDPAAIAKEFGFASGEQCTYTRGQDSLNVQLYHMKDASAAYGEYAYLRTPDLPKATFNEHSSLSANRALILDGDFVLDVTGKNVTGSAQDVKALLAAVHSRASGGQLPALWQHLPADGVVLHSDHYILGPVALAQFFPLAQNDWIGFAVGAEAETAHYRLGNSDMTLVIADFPTPQIAMAKVKELQQKFGIQADAATPSSSNLYAKRDGTLIAIVSGAKSFPEANKVLGQIQTETEVTWNEPTFQFKEPSIEMMVVGSIVGTGVICGFALIAGLAFGGFRLFIKRLLPGKVFDRADQLQVLQLGLASKPIDAEDFYGISGRLIPKDTVDKNLPDRTAMRIFR